MIALCDVLNILGWGGVSLLNIATGKTSQAIAPFHFFFYNFNFYSFYHEITFFLTSPRQPDPIGALESESSKSTFQLLFARNLDNVATGFHHKRFVCIDDPSATDFQGQVAVTNNFL